mmetsp:Transcript_128734/g.305453  ORF Transcript_128734/g.305453 Transcript_128734/m.305453 type:complete len:205 (+) Transcript_128734:253-867(+)
MLLPWAVRRGPEFEEVQVAPRAATLDTHQQWHPWPASRASSTRRPTLANRRAARSPAWPMRRTHGAPRATTSPMVRGVRQSAMMASLPHNLPCPAWLAHLRHPPSRAWPLALRHRSLIRIRADSAERGTAYLTEAPARLSAKQASRPHGALSSATTVACKGRRAVRSRCPPWVPASTTVGLEIRISPAEMDGAAIPSSPARTGS